MSNRILSIALGLFAVATLLLVVTRGGTAPRTKASPATTLGYLRVGTSLDIVRLESGMVRLTVHEASRDRRGDDRPVVRTVTDEYVVVGWDDDDPPRPNHVISKNAISEITLALSRRR